MYNLDCLPANSSEMKWSVHIDLRNPMKALKRNALGIVLQGYPSYMHHSYKKYETVN